MIIENVTLHVESKILHHVAYYPLAWFPIEEPRRCSWCHYYADSVIQSTCNIQDCWSSVSADADSWLTDWRPAASYPPRAPAATLQISARRRGSEAEKCHLAVAPSDCEWLAGPRQGDGKQMGVFLKGHIPRGSYECVPQGRCLFYAGGGTHLYFVECGNNDGIFLKALTQMNLSVRWTVKQSRSPLPVVQHCIRCENVLLLLSGWAVPYQCII